MDIQALKDKKVGFISLGCDKNRVDLEKIIFNIKSFGFQIVNDCTKANIIIINTCSFLESSRMEAIENILEMSELKNSANLEKLIVTGCLNELGYSDLKDSLEEVDSFVRISDNDNIIDIIANLYGIDLHYHSTNGRILTTPNHVAYLKISDGCNNFCSYCLIPYIRGRFKSRTIEELVEESKILASQGVKELTLVAQDVTKYGVDLYNKKMLVELLQQLSKINGIEWIRLLYCYPEEIDDNLILEIKNNPKILKYLDIPLQHVSDKILKSMNRRSNYLSICNLFDKLRNEIPNIVIRTTFILGFPDENNDDFNKIIEFIKKYKLDNVGFFKYSREEGTRSYDFENQISDDVKDERLNEISQIQYEIQNNILQRRVGDVYSVIIDEIDDNYSIGRFYGQAPQIDGLIFIDEVLKIGEIYNIKITDYLDYDLKGELYHEHS
ncbi:MAG: 30S ribosomal protein S12 methylthiotransferase RimO [Clostridiales bacterium]|nr:30S ribosomal protein S12 methylthiotransferase RimO [Clostridiales bacterium]